LSETRCSTVVILVAEVECCLALCRSAVCVQWEDCVYTLTVTSLRAATVASRLSALLRWCE